MSTSIKNLTRLKVSGFRRLFNVDIDFKGRPLAVLIGPNGAGKTSLLDSFLLLSASATGRLQKKISDLSGIVSILTKDRSSSLTFELGVEVAGRDPLNYYLEVSAEGISYNIIEERLSQGADKSKPFIHIESHGRSIKYSDPNEKGAGFVKPTWEHDLFETSLNQVPKMYQDPERLRQYLSSCILYGQLNVATNSPIRTPQSMQPSNLPGVNGENLASCLYYLRETDSDRYELVEDTLRAAFPSFQKLNFPPVAAGTLSVTWKDSSFSEGLYMHQLSEGTLRFLWLTALLTSEKLPEITLIDEPEVSLHPELLRLLVDLLRDASRRTQLIVATHADRLLRFLKPEEVIVCDQDEEGMSLLSWADQIPDVDLQQWLEDYTLDELWAMNLLGGRP